MPAAALVVELATRMCSEHLFDPVPTVFHAALVALVPIGNLAVWLVLRQSAVRLRTPLLWLNGAVIGIAGFYALLFAPLMPVSAMAIMLAGLGLLGFSPLCGVIAAFWLRGYVKRMPAPPRARTWTHTLIGVMVAALLMLGAEFKSTVTRIGLHMAVSDHAAERVRGIELLRDWGDRDILLRACYRPLSYERDILAYIVGAVGDVHVGTDDARAVYYRVTGRAFDNERPPTSLGNRFIGGWDEQWAWDENQGGEAVGRRVRGLSLVSSRVDGSLDGDAAVGYLEWTMRFRNTSALAREARAVVRLPPGAVVSRVTLWIDGEPREAAFAGRGEVRAAYERIVRRSRDPLLVTSVGPDRVLIQCFPVPVQGEMQVRIGITSPLAIHEPDQAQLRLPYMDEHNFLVDLSGGTTTHEVWLEADRPLRSTHAALPLKAEPAGDAFALRGSLGASGGHKGGHKRGHEGDKIDGSDRNWGRAWIQVERSPTVVTAFARDPVAADHTVHQQWHEPRSLPPEPVAIVLDGSASMAASIDETAQVIAEFAAARAESELPLLLLLAGDTPQELYRIPNAQPSEDGRTSAHGDIDQLAARLQNLDIEGGRDNATALIRAWDWLQKQAQSADGKIVWLHGPQPIPIGDHAGLLHRIERRPRGALIYERQIAAGRNVLVEELHRHAKLRTLPPSSPENPPASNGNSVINTTVQDLRQLLLGANSALVPTRIQRPHQPSSDAAPDPTQDPTQESAQDPATKQTSAHLVRLWAADEVMRAVTEGHRDDAIATAVAYQLITPVSGAVVLESQAQYEEASLKPVSPGSVPTIPEPETWLLLIVTMAALAMTWTSRRRRMPECS